MCFLEENYKRCKKKKKEKNIWEHPLCEITEYAFNYSLEGFIPTSSSIMLHIASSNYDLQFLIVTILFHFCYPNHN